MKRRIGETWRQTQAKDCVIDSKHTLETGASLPEQAAHCGEGPPVVFHFILDFESLHMLHGWTGEHRTGQVSVWDSTQLELL